MDREKRTDLLLNGSIWDEPRDFMMGLLNRERYLLTEWSSQATLVSDALAEVGLVASALDGTSGYISVEYSFENAAAAEAEMATAEDQAL